jgi:hypothetical protein
VFSFIHFGPLTRESRTALTLVVALVAGGVLVGPAFATLASSPPPAAINPAHEIPLTIPVIPVKVFRNLGERDCLPSPLLREGPSRMRACVIGRIFEEGRVDTYGPGTLHVTYSTKPEK